jgi:hypothetical protein
MGDAGVGGRVEERLGCVELAFLLGLFCSLGFLVFVLVLLYLAYLSHSVPLEDGFEL